MLPMMKPPISFVRGEASLMLSCHVRWSVRLAGRLSVFLEGNSSCSSDMRAL